MAVLTKGNEALKSSKPADNAASRRRRRNFNRREAIAGYLFITPWIIGFLVFTLGAMIYSLVISFSY
jgi:multiple sugar transport system permease protein